MSEEGVVITRFVYQLSGTTMNHARKIYGFLDALGDYGGVEGVVMTVAALLLAPIASHGFYIKAIEKLFLAKSSDLSLFRDKKNKKYQKKQADENKLRRTLSIKEAKLAANH